MSPGVSVFEVLEDGEAVLPDPFDQPKSDPNYQSCMAFFKEHKGLRLTCHIFPCGPSGCPPGVRAWVFFGISPALQVAHLRFCSRFSFANNPGSTRSGDSVAPSVLFHFPPPLSLTLGVQVQGLGVPGRQQLCWLLRSPCPRPRPSHG